MPTPYPVPTSRAVSRVMRANRKHDTGPERALRSAMHRLGLRYRLRKPVVTPRIRVMPDATFSGTRVAVFVDGCWWHRCPAHANTPRSNAAYWVPKLARNVERDRIVDVLLVEGGWHVIRLWEHEVREDPSGSAMRVAAEVASRSKRDRAVERAQAPARPRSTHRP
jgi:DNA mismatch endonuclease (patch repair protein)